MNRKIVMLGMVVLFTLSSVSLGFAKNIKCTVDSVEGEKVTMTCKDADKFKAGDEVKVKVKSKKAVEGC